MVIAEAVDAVLSGKLCLRLSHLRESQVIEAEVGWKVRLIVPGKKRARLRYIAPLGEARPPPFVVFGDRVVLRKIESDGTNARLAHGKNHCRICLARNLHRRCLSRRACDRLSTLL